MMLLELITSLGCNFKNCNYSLIALFLRSHQEGKNTRSAEDKKEKAEKQKGIAHQAVLRCESCDGTGIDVF